MKKEKSLLIDKLKKSTKKIMLIVFTLIITLFSSSSVDATSSAPSSFVVNGAGTSTYTLGNYFNGWPYDGYWHFHRKATSEGKAIYCVEPHNKFGNDTYKLSGEADARYSYILANGYPNKSITGDDNTDYLITSFAVFYLVNPSDYIFDYMDLSNGTYKGTANTIVQEIAKLVNGSKNYAYTEPTIKVNSNNNFTLSSFQNT